MQKQEHQFLRWNKPFTFSASEESKKSREINNVIHILCMIACDLTAHRARNLFRQSSCIRKDMFHRALWNLMWYFAQTHFFSFYFFSFHLFSRSICDSKFADLSWVRLARSPRQSRCLEWLKGSENFYSLFASKKSRIKNESRTRGLVLVLVLKLGLISRHRRRWRSWRTSPWTACSDSTARSAWSGAHRPACLWETRWSREQTRNMLVTEPCVRR